MEPLIPTADAIMEPDEYRRLTRRMGPAARHLLLLAPGPQEEAQILGPASPNPGALASHYHALRRLEGDGLISVVPVEVRVETTRDRRDWEWNAVLGDWVERRVTVGRTLKKRAVKLTPLGAAVASRMRADLERAATP